MDNLDLITSLQGINRELIEENEQLKAENEQLKAENERLVALLKKYEPKQGNKTIDEGPRAIWGDGETGWGKY